MAVSASGPERPPEMVGQAQGRRGHRLDRMSPSRVGATASSGRLRPHPALIEPY